MAKASFTAQKIKSSSVNVTKSAGECGFGDIYCEEIPNGKFLWIYLPKKLHRKC